MYLWKEKVNREGKDVFCELLRVLAKRQNEDDLVVDPRMSYDVRISQIYSLILHFQPILNASEVYSCLFCAAECTSITRKKEHMKVMHMG